MKRIDLLKKKKCFSIFCGTALLFFLFTLTPQTVEAETVTESTSLVFTYSSGVGGNDFSPPFTSISADGTLIAYSSQVSSVSVLDTQEDEGVDMQLMKKVLQAQSKQDDATPLVIPDTYPLLVARPAAMVITPENTVYLTFDDGPSPYTTKILNELKKRGIKATFFVIGDQVKMYPDLAKRIVDEGHAIGIHTNTHKYEEVYASMDAFLEDYEECYKRIKEITDYPVTVTRFPGGSTMTYVKKMNGQFQAELAKRGFTYFDWNVSSGDAAPKNVTSDFIMTNIIL